MHLKHLNTNPLPLLWLLLKKSQIVAYENRRFSSLIAASGRFARRNVYDSATEIPYWWRKICPESGHKRWLDIGVVTLFYPLFQTTYISQKAAKQNSQNLWYIYFSRRSIWILLELVRKWTQHFTKIDQEKRKIEHICIWNPTTTEFIMETLIYVISMDFLSLSRRRSSSWKVPSGEERGETAVFAG